MAQLTDLEQVRRTRARKRTARNLLILAVLAGVVFLSVTVIRQTGEMDLKTVYSDLRAGRKKGIGYPIPLPGGQVLSLNNANDILTLLTDTNLYTYNASGGQMMGVQHGMGSPVLKTSNGKNLVYDRGGSRMSIFSKSALIRTVATDYKIHTADLAANGNFAAATGAGDALASVTVYNREGNKIFGLKVDTPVISVALEDNHDAMLVGYVDAANGEFLSSIRKFQFNYNQGDVANVNLPGELLLTVDWIGGDAVRALTDQHLIRYNGELKETASFAFGEQKINRFTNTPDGRQVLVFGNFEKDKHLTVVTLDRDFKELFRFSVNYDLSALAADNQYLYLASRDRLHVLTFDGALVASMQIGSLSRLQPVGNLLCYTTNTAIGAVEINKFSPPTAASSAAQSSGDSSAVSGASDASAASAPAASKDSAIPAESGNAVESAKKNGNLGE